jgi:hypothetical protein
MGRVGLAPARTDGHRAGPRPSHVAGGGSAWKPARGKASGRPPCYRPQCALKSARAGLRRRVHRQASAARSGSDVIWGSYQVTQRSTRAGEMLGRSDISHAELGVDRLAQPSCSEDRLVIEGGSLDPSLRSYHVRCPCVNRRQSASPQCTVCARRPRAPRTRTCTLADFLSTRPRVPNPHQSFFCWWRVALQAWRAPNPEMLTPPRPNYPINPGSKSPSRSGIFAPDTMMPGRSSPISDLPGSSDAQAYKV